MSDSPKWASNVRARLVCILSKPWGNENPLFACQPRHDVCGHGNLHIDGGQDGFQFGVEIAHRISCWVLVRIRCWRQRRVRLVRVHVARRNSGKPVGNGMMSATGIISKSRKRLLMDFGFLSSASTGGNSDATSGGSSPPAQWTSPWICVLPRTLPEIPRAAGPAIGRCRLMVAARATKRGGDSTTGVRVKVMIRRKALGPGLSGGRRKYFRNAARNSLTSS